MDTLQKILNSVHSGYLNSPGGPAALHGTSARREAGGQWRGQLLEAGWPLKGQWRLPARHALRPWKVASVRLGSVHPEAGVCVPRPASCPAAAARSAPGTCFTRHLTPHAEQPAVPRREPHSGTDPGVPPDHLGVFVTLLLALSLPLFSAQGPVTFILRHIYAIWVKEQSEKSFPLSVLINSPET